MSGRWFRMYENVINDPKVMKLPEATRWHWVALLCSASMNKGAIPSTADLAFLLRKTESQAAAILAELTVAGLLDRVDGGFAPHNWGGRQFKSDGSTERVKRFRNKQGNVSVTADETGPEQSITEQNKAEQTPGAASVDLERELRADLTAIFDQANRPVPNLQRASIWLAKGYSSPTVCRVVRELLGRKPDIASLAYFDSAIATADANRSATPSELAAATANTDYDKAAAFFARSGVWFKGIGPAPGQSGCKASTELLEKHGIGPDGEKLRKMEKVDAE